MIPKVGESLPGFWQMPQAVRYKFSNAPILTTLMDKVKAVYLEMQTR